MIHISPEQLRVLAQPQRAQLERELIEMVLEVYRDEAEALCGRPIDPAALAELVGDLVERAWSYGLDDDADVERYVELSLEHGPAFEYVGELAWVIEILRGPSNGTAKLVLIEQRLGGGE